MKRWCVGLWLVFCVAAGPGIADQSALNAVNAIRAQAGVAAIGYSAKLEKAAQQHADDMARKGFFDHRGSNGSTVGQRVRKTGYRWCTVAENIGKGQRDLGAVMAVWAGSAGHYKNIVKRDAQAMGLARGPGNLWVLVLAGKSC